MKDLCGREINYMRISITDRCNLRCQYCMPDGIELCPMKDLLTYEEIVSVCQEAVSLGIHKFKITGGEPLVRRGCADLIRMIYEIPGTEEVTLTTNGVLLEKYLPELWNAGLRSVNISLDTLDQEFYNRLPVHFRVFFHPVLYPDRFLLFSETALYWKSFLLLFLLRLA